MRPYGYLAFAAFAAVTVTVPVSVTLLPPESVTEHVTV